MPDAAYDLVGSIGTLDHVAAQEACIAGFARILSADGVLIVSSPDKHAYSDVSGFRNEFHVRELYRGELLALLTPHFPYVRLYGQKLLFQSAIWSLSGEAGHAEAVTADLDGNRVESGLQYAPLYFIAFCSRQTLDWLPALSPFCDVAEAVYAPSTP